MRLREAKKMLVGAYSIKDVCLTVGFDSISSFIKLFKKQEGATPLEYSKMIKTKIAKTKLQPLHYIPFSYAQYLGWEKQQDSTIKLPI